MAESAPKIIDPANPFAGWPRPHFVSLMAPTGPEEARSNLGEPEQQWREIAKLWASIKPLRGQEIWQARQVQADVTHYVRIRYRPGVDATMELDHHGRRFKIFAVLNVEEMDRVLELHCQERPSNA